MNKKYIILLFFLLSIKIFSNSETQLIDSIYYNNNIELINHIKEPVLKKIILYDFIGKYFYENDLKNIKKMIPNYNSELKDVIFNKSIDIRSDKITKYLYRMGYKIKNLQFFVNKNEIHELIKYFPSNPKTKKIFFECIDTLNKEEIIFFAINNLNLDIIENIHNKKNDLMEITFIYAILKKDTSFLKKYTNNFLWILEKITNRKYRKFVGKFINENTTNNTMIYYKGLYYENNGEYYEALKIYEKINDEEAIIRMLAMIGEYYSKAELNKLFEIKDYKFSSFKYHKAKYLYISKRRKQAKELFNEIIEEDPISYYAIKSRWILKKKMLIEHKKYNTKFYEDLYYQFKKHDKEDLFFNYVYELYKEKKENPLKIAYLYKKLNIYNKTIHYGFRSYFANYSANECIEYIFIMPYYKIFKKAAKENNIDLALLYAIAREESWFNKNAISPVGAKGIMQLMDFVYEEYFSDKDYFNVEKNIAGGAMHIKNYMEYFEVNVAYGIMSYNAGPGNVAKWERKHIDWELYLEMIPYRETRKFIKNVLRNYYFYKFVFNVS